MDGKALLLGHVKSTRMRQRFTVRVAVVFLTFLAALTLLYLLACRWQLTTDGAIDWARGSRLGVTQKFQVARRCVEPARTICVTVTDLIDESSNTAKRVLHTVNMTAPVNENATAALGLDRIWSAIIGENLESIVSLIPPKGRTASDSDTRLWAVNHSTVDWQHTAAMIAAPLAVGALAVPSSDDVSGSGTAVLVLGMGGGTLDMFYSERFPQMNISVVELNPIVDRLAHEWFDVRETARRHTIISDARRAVDDAFGQGDFYDVIVLDACSLDGDVPCPDAKLLKPSTLRKIRTIVKSTGALVVNVLPLAHECDNLKRIYRFITAYFPTCAAAYFRAERNTILVCTPYAIATDNLAKVRGAWNAAWQGAVRALDLNAHLAPTSTHFQLMMSGGGKFRLAKFDSVTEC